MKTLLLGALLTLAAAKPRQMVPRNTEAAIPEGRKPETPYYYECEVFKSSEDTITSPNYPNDYPEDLICNWYLKAPAGKRIKLTFSDMQMLGRRIGSAIGCYPDALILQPDETLNNDVIACGSELTGRSYTSVDNNLRVIFFMGTDHGGHRGFSAEITHV